MINILLRSQEQGEFLSGQVFCYGSLLRSGRLNDEEAADVVKCILEVAKKRSYLVIASYVFVVDYVKKVSRSYFLY